MTGKKNKNRKVLFVTASTQGGGAERMLFNIISSLDCHIEKELVITSCDTPPQNRCIDYPTVSLRKKHALSSFGAIVRHINAFRPIMSLPPVPRLGICWSCRSCSLHVRIR